MAIADKIRLSHSSLDTLHACERKFELYKLLQGEGNEKEDTEHTVFGKAFGAGCQSYLEHQDKERALFAAWLEYWPAIEAKNKTQSFCITILERAFFALDTLLMEYELVSFNGKPATELSFCLHIDQDFYFVGHIDAVLKHRFTGQYLVLDFKTTGLQLLDLNPLYKHSGQCLGYSIALDRIVGQTLADYGVMYFVAQLGKTFGEAKMHVLTYEKTLLDRFNWFLTLGLDVKHLHEMMELGVFPKRASACLSFMKPCPHFGTCHLHGFDKPKKRVLDEIEYDFEYQLDDIIQDHLVRMDH